MAYPADGRGNVRTSRSFRSSEPRSTLRSSSSELCRGSHRISASFVSPDGRRPGPRSCPISQPCDTRTRGRWPQVPIPHGCHRPLVSSRSWSHFRESRSLSRSVSLNTASVSILASIDMVISSSGAGMPAPNLLFLRDNPPSFQPNANRPTTSIIIRWIPTQKTVFGLFWFGH